jgi:hypothetical protein
MTTDEKAQALEKRGDELADRLGGRRTICRSGACSTPTATSWASARATETCPVTKFLSEA